MKAGTRTFIRDCFTDYYDKNLISPPSSPENREFGFIFFDDSYPENIWMKRHLGFNGKEDVQRYVKSMIPAHAYYSTAYYENPGAPTMAAKGWLGADLIFDLDADHLMRGSYKAMLERIKEEAVKLINVLTEEFGIDNRYMKIVFSGGRGYHIHVFDIAFRSYTSQERREIVDYICGTGISPSILNDYKKGRKGWHERLRLSLLKYLSSCEARPKKEVIKEITAFPGIGQTRSERFVQMIPELIDDLKNNPDKINTKDQTFDAIATVLLSEKTSPLYLMIKEAGIQADEPVTTDIRRLIRLPGSLHAKSGFRVTTIGIKELYEFNPLIDAVPFGDRPVKIDSSGNYTVSLLDNDWMVPKGVTLVPEAVALYMCCRGMAEIGGDRPVS